MVVVLVLVLVVVVIVILDSGGVRILPLTICIFCLIFSKYR